MRVLSYSDLNHHNLIHWAGSPENKTVQRARRVHAVKKYCRPNVGRNTGIRFHQLSKEMVMYIEQYLGFRIVGQCSG